VLNVSSRRLLGSLAAAFRGKYDFGTELFVLCIDGRCGTDAEWEVQQAQGSVDGLSAATYSCYRPKTILA